MDISSRIQELRKKRGVSQDQLANEIGVSRQAVSKWESQQSLPDLEKIVTLSNYFNVSTDYIIKGTMEEKSNDINLIVSKVLYIGSVFLIALGLISAFANWYENQNMKDVLGSVIIQAVGIVGYFIGAVLSPSKSIFVIRWLNIIMAIFIPLSLSVTFICNGLATPYPTGYLSAILFMVIYSLSSIVIYRILKRN